MSGHWCVCVWIDRVNYLQRASPPAAAPKPAASAAERAGGKPEAVLACGRRGGHLATAIARGGLSALEAALATAPREVREGGVGAEAQARCDRLLVY